MELNPPPRRHGAPKPRRLALALVVPAVIAATLCGASALPASAATVTGAPVVTPLDSNGDGVIDSLAADLDGDGWYDTYALIGTNGVVLGVGQDQNENGVLDTTAVDTNGDGVIDIVALDTDEDGTPDLGFQDSSEMGQWRAITLQKTEQSDPNIITFQDPTIDVGPGEDSPLVQFLRENGGALNDPSIASIFNSTVAMNEVINRTNALPDGFGLLYGTLT